MQVSGPMTPAWGGLIADASYAYTLHGANFAPTGALRCRYGFSAAGDALGIFVSPTSMACGRPAFDAPMDVPVVTA